jgi:hypothetical protein
MANYGLADKYEMDSKILCGKIKKYFDKDALKRASVFCDG